MDAVFNFMGKNGGSMADCAKEGDVYLVTPGTHNFFQIKLYETLFRKSWIFNAFDSQKHYWVTLNTEE